MTRAGRAAVLLAMFSTACAAGGLLLQLLAQADGRPVQRLALSDAAVAVLFPAVGAVVLVRDPRNRCGWVLSSCALVGVSTLAHQWAYDAEVTRPGVLPLGDVAVWLSAWTFWPYWLQTTLLPVLFPRGRLPSPRWRPYVVTVFAVASVGTLASAFKPDDDVEGMGLANPLGLGGPEHMLPWVIGQAGAVAVLGLLATPIALVGLFRRVLRAEGVERAQLQWLLLGLLACFVLGLTSVVLPTPGDVLFAVAFAAIPVSVAIAVVRHGLLDIEVAISRTLVYATLTALSVLAYVGLVALVAQDGRTSPVLAAVVVVASASARSRLQRLVDRRLFGARRDPYAVVRQVGESAASTGLDGLVEAVRDALRLPLVQLLDATGTVLAESGAPVAGTHVVPVVDRGRGLGVLVIGRRSRGERLRPEEESALVEVARRAAGLLVADELQADLRRSWEGTVLAREEERRRLRRDLHDGVGPALAGMALQLDALAGRLAADPALAARAEDLRDRLRGTVTEVRQIVDGLRPVPVDQLGLAGALRGLATDGVQVEVDLPRELPAAVEVAAYRIAGEALANALRHAGATRVALTATLHGDGLRLEVADDGIGFGAGVTAGVGLQSLHERAAEVGGALSVESAVGSGTRVTAVLPVQRAP